MPMSKCSGALMLCIGTLLQLTCTGLDPRWCHVQGGLHMA